MYLERPVLSRDRSCGGWALSDNIVFALHSLFVLYKGCTRMDCFSRFLSFYRVLYSATYRFQRNTSSSSPISSTKFSYTCKPPVTQPCHTLSHKSGLARMVFASTLRRRTLAQKKRVILYSITALGFAEKPEGESCPLSRSMASKRSSTKRRKAEGGPSGPIPKVTSCSQPGYTWSVLGMLLSHPFRLAFLLR